METTTNSPMGGYCDHADIFSWCLIARVPFMVWAMKFWPFILSSFLKDFFCARCKCSLSVLKYLLILKVQSLAVPKTFKWEVPTVIRKQSLWFCTGKVGWKKGCLSAGSFGARAQRGEGFLQQAGTPKGWADLIVPFHLNWELCLPAESVQPLDFSPV